MLAVVAVIAIALTPALAVAQTAPKIPLVEELTVVTAIADQIGDYESIKRLTRVTAEEVELSYSADTPKGLENSTRTILRADLKTSSAYARTFGADDPKVLPGTTAISTSAAVLEDLKANRAVRFATQIVSGDQLVAAEGTIEIVSSEPVPLPIIVNDQPMQLSAIHARGRFQASSGDVGAETEFYFLDDPENPLCLKYDVEGTVRAKLTVVKITFPSSESRLEEVLSDGQRASVYGIYFGFGSAQVRDESEPALKEIAGLMSANPAWKLRIEGHTDSIGGQAFNQTLSERRAVAVKDALVSRYSVPQARLSTAGFGAERPKETNATLEGRNRNRRVELVRE